MKKAAPGIHLRRCHLAVDVYKRQRRGQKIAILGSNGAGKTTFLKTVAGFLQPVDGEFSLGNHTTIGYFDQHSAGIESGKTVFEHFTGIFPSLTQKDARSILGAYLFGGREAEKKVSSLSGGEKARLVLAELLQSRPNFLVLDEPTTVSYTHLQLFISIYIKAISGMSVNGVFLYLS